MSEFKVKIFDILTGMLFPLYELSGGIEGKTNSPPKKILLIKPDHLGDVILTTPALAALHIHFPKAEIWYLAKSTSLPILRNNPALSRLVEFNAPWCCRPGERPMSWRELSTLSRIIRRQTFDLSICFQDNARTHLFAALCGVPKRLGYAPRGGKYLLTDVLAQPDEDEHAVISHNRLVEKLGAKPAELPTKIFLTEDEQREGKELLQECEFLFHVGAAHRGKMVSVELGGAIVKAVTKKCGKKMALVGGDQEQERLAAIHASCPSETKLLPQLPLRQLASVIDGASLFFGHDSGPGHMASALGTYAIIFFGQGNPSRWAPWGEKTTVVRSEVCKSVCTGRPLHDECKNIEAIEPNEVAERAFELLNEMSHQ